MSSLTESLTVAEAIVQRRSTQEFSDRAIDREILTRLVELTLEAPSSYNLQPWRIVLVSDDERRQALHKAAFGQPQILEAPTTFVFATTQQWRDDLPKVVQAAVARDAWPEAYGEQLLLNVPKAQEYLESSGKLREYNIKDAMIAASFLTLAAQSFGLTSCFMNGWREDLVNEAIGAPADTSIAVIVPVGYAKESGEHPGRFPLSHCVRENGWETPFDSAPSQD